MFLDNNVKQKCKLVLLYAEKSIFYTTKWLWKTHFFFFAKQLLYREVFSIISFTTGIKKNDYAHETFLWNNSNIEILTIQYNYVNVTVFLPFSEKNIYTVVKLQFNYETHIITNIQSSYFLINIHIWNV